MVIDPPRFIRNSTLMDLSDIPLNVCCAGIRLGLQNPNDADLTFEVQAFVNDTLFVHNFTKKGDHLFVQDVVAGKEYIIQVIIANKYKKEIRTFNTRPLLGLLSANSVFFLTFIECVHKFAIIQLVRYS